MESKIVARYLRATEDTRILEPVVDSALDRFTTLLLEQDPLGENRVSQFLETLGVTPELVNGVDPNGKEAGEMIKALGGLVKKALWYLLVRPFKLIESLISKPTFRESVKATFWKALRKDTRATRHLVEVFGKKLGGEPVHPQELKNAQKQLVTLLGKAVLIYLTGPQFAAAFNGPVWTVISNLVVPGLEILYSLLLAPITAVTRKLLTEDLG